MKIVQKQVGVSRRGFLAAGAGFGLFNLVPASVLGADAPSNKVTMGLIGAGGQGMWKTCHVGVCFKNPFCFSPYYEFFVLSKYSLTSHFEPF